ncbi:MAG: S-layer homology domain-containing protein, partial [Firmicutes bacterium]|nr:S-layer homology domain-containing protein [Bacillota bacterium]
AGLTEGAYYVRVKANGTVLASDSQTVIINAYVAPGEEVPGAAFTATGPDSGTLTGLVAKANYTISGAGIDADTVIFADKDGTAVIASGLSAGTLSVVKNGNTTTTVNSDARTIAITKADVPELVSAPGYIPTTNAHEYSKDGTEWLSCTGALSGLAGGTYYVRVKASGTVLASDAQEVTVQPYYEEPAPDSEVKSGETVSAAELSQLVREDKPLTVGSESGATVTFDTDALKDILEQTDGAVTVTFESEPAPAAGPDGSAELVADIPAGAKAEGAVVYDLTVTSGGNVIEDFGGTVTLEMPYEAAEGEKPERVTVWQYVESEDPDEPGTWVKLESAYDPETGTVSVDVDGSGRFYVGYDPFPYTDVAEDAYYYEAVDWADRLGITEGVDDDSFEPEGICLRAQMVTFLWRAAGEPEPTIDSCPFTDVDPAAYYYKAVLWAYENGITEGVGDNLFDPEGTVDRAQSIVFLFRALAAQGGVTISFVDTPFTDVPAGEYYTYAVQWAYENGVTEGTSGTTFSPDDDCRRSDVVTFLYRAYAKEEETGGGN